MSQVLKIESTVDRHHPDLPRFVIVPNSAVENAWALDRTTTVQGTLDGAELGRRSLKRWDSDRWWIDLPDRWCLSAEIETGDRVELELRLASEDLPAELANLLANDHRAKAAWERRTPSQRRALREAVIAAKKPETRVRRARRALLGE